jgi:O-antigen ligase
VFGLAGLPLFTYSDEWGSERGFTWKMGAILFTRMGPLQRLIGIGPDCFAEFLYSFSDLAAACEERFGTALLKNAHNEPLTTLVNTGMLGLFAYLSIFFTRFVRLLKSGAAKPLLYTPALCIFSYLLHNIVSFSQILNLPYIFIIMAIGEACLKGETK